MSIVSPAELTVAGQSGFDRRVAEATSARLAAADINTIQVNIGLRCNLACHHCHVESSPARQEEMDWPTMQLVLTAARQAHVSTIDITGGAPEMNPNLRRLVVAGTTSGFNVIMRTNLTIMLEEGYEDLPGFFASQRVHLIASLPCYLETNVDKQRGNHVYHDSIEVIRRLNDVGYSAQPELRLDLVYNPGGASLPPEQHKLEEAYRRELDQRFGIRFNRLLTITNIAIGRFLHDLRRQARAEQYQQLLRDSFNPATINGLMCRHQLHIGWDGTMYDCDFNFALGLPASAPGRHVRDFNPAAFLARRIITGEHCFACTAGCGSSCGGALV
ncbi:MAG TPA: arsenosugar biosynthesis radical SAM (seleno)protein ArsS [Tepidisphaeraceae bacterium]|nr:arsenosugar biosynthesis radical SAM (seleno)protein ArsS [Tepidisphaeraceae bacterium]